MQDNHLAALRSALLIIVALGARAAWTQSDGLTTTGATRCGGHLDVPALNCNPVEAAKLVADDAASADWFGRSVAVCNDTALIGAFYDDYGGWSDGGSAYVFVRGTAGWTQHAKLIPDDPGANYQFGQAVALGEGIAVIGAPLANAAYVFVRLNDLWTQAAKLVASDAAQDDCFGYWVAVDGNTVVIGAPGRDCAGWPDVGAAYVFVGSGGSWVQEATLTASDFAPNELFGESTAVDGDTALIGASSRDGNRGAVYVFGRSNGTWVQQAILTASDAALNDQFGRSVTLKGDTAVIGAPYDDAGLYNSGSAYVFTRSSSLWAEQAKLVAPDPVGEALFGCSAALDADTALIGAYKDTGSYGSGSAYVFRQSGEMWTLAAKLVPADGYTHDYFGRAVGLHHGTAVAGAHLDDHDGGQDAGSAYVFELNCLRVGDLNCDGLVDFGDINPFVLYMSNFPVWQTTYGGCPAENGDIDGDGVFPSFADINPFVALLAGN